MKIQSLSTHNMRNDAHFQFHTEFRDLVRGEGLVKECFDETASRTTDIVMKQARAQLDDVYKTIVERVNALAVIEGIEAYETFIKTLNAVVAKYSVKHHHHKHNHTDSQQTTQNNNTQNGGSI